MSNSTADEIPTPWLYQVFIWQQTPGCPHWSREWRPEHFFELGLAPMTGPEVCQWAESTGMWFTGCNALRPMPDFILPGAPQLWRLGFTVRRVDCQPLNDLELATFSRFTQDLIRK